MVEKADFVFLKLASSPCDCGINQKFFYDLQQLSSNEERIEYRRRHRDELVTRAKCCYKVPETYRGSGEIHPDAILWRRQHENGEQCGFCPFCISFSAMSLLVKLSSHVGLIQPKAHPDSYPRNSADRKEAETKLELAKAFIPKEVINKDELPSYILEDSIMDDHFSLSGKMAVLARLLKTIDRQGGRVLVFSAYTQSLDLLENYVKTSGYSFLRMDGTTPRHKRQDLADEFNNSPGILLFLLSTKAMGLGLNLTSANFVIIFDVEW
jgi:Helicase conserved C-terminal domain